MIPPIVSPEWLAANREDVHDVVVADVRWYLDGRSGADAFRNGHIPGAVWIDLDRWLAAPPSPAEGRHPLPHPDRFAEGMASAGISDDTTVVAYDDLGGMAAGRLVWMLRALGVEAALLDGGLGAWTGPLETGDPAPPAPGRFTARPWPAEKLAGIDEVELAVAARAAGTVVVDARAPERYRGEVEPIDPRAGHIPGAINLPFGGNLGPDGRFLSTNQLEERFASLAGRNVVVYCGSGVSACHDLLAMEAAGVKARLFAGSWSAWSSDPSRPAAVGPDPGGDSPS